MKQHYIHKISALVLAAAALLFSGCDSLDVKGMFFSSGDSTEERVADWMEWDAAHGENRLVGVPDSYKVYVCSDPHIDDSCPRVEEFLRQECADPEAVMSLILGDLANKAGEGPYKLISNAIQNRPAPAGSDTCFVVIGNHDLYFDCNQHFKDYFHTSTYTIVVETVGGKKDLFVMLDSGNSTLGARQTSWLRDLLAHRDEYRCCTVCTHTSLFRNSYNYSTTPAANFPLDEYYSLTDLMTRHHVDLFLMGHFHHKEWHTIGGVEYVMASNLNSQDPAPSYVVASYGDNGVEFKYIDL